MLKVNWSMSYVSSAEKQAAGPAANGAGILVVGLGNPILGDDGIGWHVAQQVRRQEPAVEVECIALGGLSLMERLVGYNKVIIIDAIHLENSKPGSVAVCPLSDLPDLSTGHTTSAHDTSLQAALTLGRQMGAVLPDIVMIVAVSAEHVYEFSEELSPEVAAAVPEATRAVLNLLDDFRK